MYRICKTFRFEAAHTLHMGQDFSLEPHKCSRVHGHSYTVEVICSSRDLDRYNVVEDMCYFDDVKILIGELDHRDLNAVIGRQPTAEKIAKWIFDKTIVHHKNLERVRVWETHDCWAEYDRETCFRNDQALGRSEHPA